MFFLNLVDVEKYSNYLSKNIVDNRIDYVEIHFYNSGYFL